jgi:hypothetical protein
LQGKIGGFVLQLIAGIGKLRVADATARALAVWSRQFSTQKRNFLASQRAANALGVFETAYPLIATLVIFASATFLKSKLLVTSAASWRSFPHSDNRWGRLAHWLRVSANP